MLHLTKKNLLPLITPYLPNNPTIIEAGTFDGKDTQQLSQQWPQGTIHAFEPVPEIYTLLKNNTAHLDNVQCHQRALSNTTGSATFHVSELPTKPGQPFQAGSLLKPKERLRLSPAVYTTTITVPTITLDAWADQYQVHTVDFLWLDLQGFELNVMQASDRIMATVRVIYTEVEFIEAYENQYLYAEVKQWLEQQGFSMIGRDFSDESRWFFGNALFVRNAMEPATSSMPNNE